MDILRDLAGTPIPNVLVIAGVGLLVLAAIGQIRGKVDPGKWGRVASGVLGAALLSLGLYVNASAPNGSLETKPAPFTPQPTPTPRPAPEPTPAPVPNGGNSHEDAVPKPPEPPKLPTITLQVFDRESEIAAHPQATVQVDAGWKIISGGAHANWRTAGSLLTESYPADSRTWVASSKDHLDSEPATITAVALAIFDPNNEWEVAIVSKAGGTADHPTAQARLEDGYRLTGGGARIMWSGAGNLLTASFPQDDRTWVARGKDHLVSSPAAVTAYAIGIRARNGAPFPSGRIMTIRSAIAPHPQAELVPPDGSTLLGGGAEVNWMGAGNLLTASFPTSRRTWSVKAKDHRESDPATVTVYGIVFDSVKR